MSESVFHDLAEFVAIPRVDGLSLSPDGSRAVVTVAEPDDARARYIASLWDVDTDGRRPARRLSRGEQSAWSAVHDGDGVLWFLRFTPADPTSSTPESTAIWRLPDAGEAERFCTGPGGFARRLAAPSASRVLAVADMLGASPDADTDLRSARTEARVGAILHDSPVVRQWDHDLGPGVPWLLDVTTGDPRPVHGPPGAALRAAQALSRVDRYPDTSPRRHTARARPRLRRRHPVGSGVGSLPAQSRLDRRRRPGDRRHRRRRQGTPGGTHRPGRRNRPDVRVITDDRYAYSHHAVHPDGRRLVALRSSIDTPPHVVVVSMDDGDVTVPPSPAALPELPGAVETIRAVADDGTVIRAALVLPSEAGPDHPVPLLLWAHGGPVLSWNAWSWRWNPGSTRRADTRCCCRTRHCPPGMGTPSSTVGGAPNRSRT